MPFLLVTQPVVLVTDILLVHPAGEGPRTYGIGALLVRHYCPQHLHLLYSSIDLL